MAGLPFPGIMQCNKTKGTHSEFSSCDRPFALRGHVSFATMLEGKHIGCYALLWKNGCLIGNTRGK